MPERIQKRVSVCLGCPRARSWIVAGKGVMIPYCKGRDREHFMNVVYENKESWVPRECERWLEYVVLTQEKEKVDEGS